MKKKIGILGDGQLAQMTCLAGQALGYEMHVYASAQGNPATFTADRVWVGEWTDEGQLTAFAKAVDVVTYDTELLPIAAVRLVAGHTKACPHPDVLWMAQNRIRERAFLRENGFPTPLVAAIHTEEQLWAGIEVVGVPAVIKTAEQGYDGKGQLRIERVEEAFPAWQALGSTPCVLEEWVAFERELSVIVAGGMQGETVAFPVIDNEHRKHILHLSTSPSSLPQAVQNEALRIGKDIASALSLVGLLTVEMFYTNDGRLLVNELAPRPHNSGHHTQLSATVSQFGQLCKAVGGEALGEVVQRPAAMVNLLGDLFASHAETKPYRHVGFMPQGGSQGDGNGDGHSATTAVRTGVYFYGKSEARAGRKMGHAIAAAETTAEAKRQVLELYSFYAESGSV